MSERSAERYPMTSTQPRSLPMPISTSWRTSNSGRGEPTSDVAAQPGMHGIRLGRRATDDRKFGEEARPDAQRVEHPLGRRKRHSLRIAAFKAGHKRRRHARAFGEASLRPAKRGPCGDGGTNNGGTEIGFSGIRHRLLVRQSSLLALTASSPTRIEHSHNASTGTPAGSASIQCRGASPRCESESPVTELPITVCGAHGAFAA